MVGLTVSQTVGPIVLEGFVGKQKGMFSAEAEEGAATPLPFVAARVAYADESSMGRLYGEDYPLTVSLSGIWGEERVGLAAEREAVAAVNGQAAPPSPPWADPVLEDLPVWLASAELFVPFGKVAGFAAEGWYGQSVHRFEGALWQVPRLDTVTGRHRPIRSAGGWGQLTVSPTASFELRALGGLDRAVEGLDGGSSPDGAPAIRENRLAAVNCVWYPLDRLALGVQLHVVQTLYQEAALGSPSGVGAAVTSRLTF
jgi:hypothetical protein